MRAQWYSLDNIPFDKMWADDQLWFPYMMNNTNFYGYFIFQGTETIIDYELQSVGNWNTVKIPKAPLGKILRNCENGDTNL